MLSEISRKHCFIILIYGENISVENRKFNKRLRKVILLFFSYAGFSPGFHSLEINSSKRNTNKNLKRFDIFFVKSLSWSDF